MFVPNFKILSQVVSEKSLTEKKFTDRQTNILTEKAKTIYPLYTSYTGGINSESMGRQQKSISNKVSSGMGQVRRRDKVCI